MKNWQPSESCKFSQNNFQRWAFGRKSSCYEKTPLIQLYVHFKILKLHINISYSKLWNTNNLHLRTFYK